MSLKDKYAIAGAATTRSGKLPGSTTVGLTMGAAKLAVEGSGIDKGEIDCVSLQGGVMHTHSTLILRG